MEYKKVKLRDVCTVKQGLQIPISKRFKEKAPNRYFYITIQFLKGNTEEYYIEGPKESVLCTKEDILVVRTGNTGIVLTDVEGCFHNNFFKVIPNEKIYRKYLYYALNNEYMYKKMLNAASGTTIPDLKHSDFYDLEIFLPEINKQYKIVNILENMDKKIKLNNKINDNLYEIQKCYFQKLFRDNSNYEIIKLDKLCNISAGGDAPKEKSNLKSDKYNIPIISNGIDNDGIYGYTNKAKITTKSITISARGTIGFKVLRNYEYYPIVRLISLFPKTDRISSEYLFCILDETTINGTGTTQQQLTVPMVKDIEIKVFDRKLIDKFTTFSIKINDKIEQNKKENQILEQLRDTLLPRLMNGEINLDKIKV